MRPGAHRAGAAPAAVVPGERHRAFADAAWEGIALLADGEVIDANDQLCAMLGHEPGALAGRSLFDVVRDGSQRAVLRAIRTGAAGPFDIEAAHRGGATLTLEVRGHAAPYDGRLVYHAAVRDVTAERRGDARRRALVSGTAGVAGARFFPSLVRHLARAFDARAAFVGEVGERDPGRLRTVSAWAPDGVELPYEFALERTLAGEALGGGLRIWDATMSRVRGDDPWLAPCGASYAAALPLHDAAGAPLGVLAIANDAPMAMDDGAVSALRVFGARAGVELERMRADARVAALNAELELRVAYRTRDLAAANLELESFSYSVSHDLRAPLRQISGFVDLLQREAGGGLTPAARQHLADIAGSAARMAGLVETLLEFSRTGRDELRRRTVKLGSLVAEVIADLSNESRGRDVEWAVGPLPEVSGDVALLRQVFQNLLGNALKYTRPRAKARIEVARQAAGEAGEVVCFVRDNGVGFDMRQAHRLFGVFQRLHSAAAFEGTGIGLAHVQRIVHRHGGRVWAQGRPDAGATFYLALPVGEVRR